MIDEPKTDKEWQARMDAETLVTAEQIKADKARLAAAQREADKMVEAKREEAAAMSRVAGKGGDTGEDKKPDTGPLRASDNPFNIGVRIKRNG